MLLSLVVPIQDIEIHGHRGMKGAFIENTLPAFSHAIQTGCRVLELDLHVTKDGVVVIHHDPLLANGQSIQKLTLSEIKQFDLQGAKIPTLQELIHLIQHDPLAKNIRLNLEIKRDPKHPEYTLLPDKIAGLVVNQVHAEGFSKRVYYTSFDPAILTEVRKLDPGARLGFIFQKESVEEADRLASGEGMALILKMAKNINVEMLIVEHSLLKKRADVESLQSQGFKVIGWTVNDPTRWKELMEMKIDGIITDVPGELLQVLGQTPF